ncbi:SGNH/GDSL hydrolase family protein [Asticcacaulis sp. 201]|uniref:SGNH/GDSL hydrolase family protein n=1 Tax=Asticcacaulis sp. 201 TaxID=3028787 RepID=UPI002916552E|nr:GDSL-type esterase/lipase family protein [Asticcacaulis sp. 201]MDV6332713.1 GDSL-type esterase/lipase family protein [Asticcacaulis sp. 201]
MRLGTAFFMGMMLAGAAQAETVSATGKTPHTAAMIPPIVGRVKAEATAVTYQWPGTYIEAAFTGPDISINLNDSANILRVYVDGVLKTTLNRPGKTVEALTHLGKGPHTIRLERLTETQGTTGAFEGFFTPKATVTAVAPRARQIEFIGDSYTVGYGNTSSKRQCTPDELWATTDTQQAFGPLTAKHYSADYQINAFSGRGIVRNYDGFIGDPLPALYPYALYDGKSQYTNPAWQPQIIVIALGGNDFSTPVHAGEKWKSQDELRADYIASYVAFVKTLRERNPTARFLLADYGEAEIIGDITEVIRRLATDGETRVSAFHAGSDFERTGCDWHLNTADSQRISQALIAYIDGHPDLLPASWQGK